MTRPQLRASLYLVFAVSGFAGLVYESIWTHYLKLFLGHAAYAQTLVLSIFMGGMALGAWLAGERSRRLRRPLVAYAVIEAILGLMALGFDPVFRGLQGWFFETAAPQLQAAAAIEALKWSLAALVILPQSVLLGTTFPLMSAGIIRIAHDMPGRVLSWLYFTNSAGAAAGVLVSGFVLIAAVGLPGAILTAGVLNLLLVLCVWLLLRAGGDVAPAAAAPADGAARGAGPGANVFLAAAFLTGAASFFYEIGWIRMLSLVIGSATHAFEFMLSAFIFGLALGGLVLRGRADRLADPLRFLGVVQVVMAVLALLTLVVYGQTFDAMAALMGVIQPNDDGYLVFNAFSHALCFALMLPVTICAGMTLPLITRLLLAQGFGEASIGRVYAANTLGSIAGVLAAVHVVMPLLGLRQVIVAGAAIDFGLGLWLLWLARSRVPAAGQWALGATAVLALAIALTVRFDASQLASGVYKTGDARRPGDVTFHRDGKTASVDVFESDGRLSIATNGKVDAALDLGPAAGPDDYTQITLAMLPALIHRDLRRAAVVGFGSGRTTHVLLQSPRLESVHTIEIEPAMVEGARAFGASVAAAYDDPRSHIHIEDAKSFFARGNRRYDAIISEPSNPWVSGVASLFSVEFYRQARRHLEPGGLFVQWLQLYEFDFVLAASIFKALGAEFADYTVYLSDSLNLVIVASADGPVPAPAWDAPAAVGMRDLMRHIRIEGPADVASLRVADRRLLEPWLAPVGAPPNSDYFPFVDQRAARHRFRNDFVDHFYDIRNVAARLGPAAPGAPSATSAPMREAAYAAAIVGRALRERRSPVPDPPSLMAGEALLTLRAATVLCDAPAREAWLFAFQRDVLVPLAPWFAAADAAAVTRALRAAPCLAEAADVRPWIDFFEAATAGNWGTVRTLGRRLLDQRQWQDPVTTFLVTEVLLADLNGGDLRPALAWLEELSRQPRPPAPVQFLIAQVLARASIMTPP